MSTEPQPAAQGERLARDRRRFGIRLAATIGALAIATGVLAFANAVQGPRVVATDADVADAARVAGSTVRFTLSSPLADLPDDAVRVEPAARAEVEVDGSEVAVTFPAPLDSGQGYEVVVTGVTAAGGGPARELRHTFTTAAEPLYVLQRTDAGDSVIRQSPGQDAEVVVEAPRLAGFAHAGDIVAAVEIADDGRDRLRFAEAGEAESTVIDLPTDGRVASISGSTTHPLIGFTIASPADAATALYTVDTSGVAAAEPQPVLGADGAPLPVVDWAFVPGTTSAVVHAPDGAVTLVDASGTRPQAPVGSHREVRGFLPGTQRLVVANPDRGALVDLRSGETSTLVLPPAELPDGAYPGRVVALDADGAHLVDVLLRSADGEFSSLLARADQTATRVVYAPVEGSRISAYCVSPNGRQVAVETVQAETLAGDALADALTTLVDVASGDILLSLAGGATDWCR